MDSNAAAIVYQVQANEAVEPYAPDPSVVAAAAQAYPAAMDPILLAGPPLHTIRSRFDEVFDNIEEREEYKVQTPNNPSQTSTFLINVVTKERVAAAKEKLRTEKQSEYLPSQCDSGGDRCVE